jgi:hypothetical protein
MSIDVHTFDRNLNSYLIQHINNITINNDLDIQTFYNTFIDKVGNESSSGKGLALIYNSVGENYDTINNIDAKRLLTIIIDYFYQLSDDKKMDLIEILSEQMADMYDTGQCSQGRTIRLIQILSYILG